MKVLRAFQMDPVKKVEVNGITVGPEVKGPEMVPAYPFTIFTKESCASIDARIAQAIKDYGFVPRKPPTLQDGEILPSQYDPVPESIYGRPVEELDGNGYEKTFCVISARFSDNYINRFSATRAFFIFTPWNPIRKAALLISTNQYFDYFVITTILVNCVFLALSNPVEQAEYVFLSIYTTEMLTKVIAKGFILNKYTYLRSAWNWLDFTVIIFGFVTIFVDLGNLSGLRTFRVFRALKTVSILPGLKTIVNALLHSISMLAEVMALTIFCLMVFALFGLQIFMGVLRNKCVHNDVFTLNQSEYESFISDENNWYHEGDDVQMCGNATGAWACPENFTCLAHIGGNPNFGYSSFDNFGWAMLTTFQLITLDFWEDIYNKLIATCGPSSLLFFIFVVFFGSFYLINLMLAVVAMSYEEEVANAKAEKLRTQTSEPKQNKQKSPNKRTVIWTRRGAITLTSTKPGMATKAPGSQIRGNTMKEQHTLPQTQLMSPAHERDGNEISKFNVSQPNGQVQTDMPPEGSVWLNKGLEGAIPSVSKQNATDAFQGSNGNIFAPGKPAPLQSPLISRPVTDNQTKISSLITISRSDDKEKTLSPVEAVFTSNLTNAFVITQKMYPDRNCACCQSCCCQYHYWLKFQYVLCLIVKDAFFELFITVCIVLNTAFLAAEHHGMSETVRHVLSIGNKVFTVIFTLEAVLKLLALSKDYFKNGWNIFDLIAVVGSLIDLSFENFNGLSVLRALRLLRVFKLAQSWTTMKVLLSIILSTIGALGNLTLVLIIIMYIFAILGMQLFGSNYKPENFLPDEVPRWNFTDFPHSFLLIFRVLCGEWIEPLFDCMRASGSGGQTCIAIFLPALIVGNFLVLNLFLALLLSSFNSDELSKGNTKDDDVSRLANGIRRLKYISTCCQSNPNAISPASLRSPESTGSIKKSPLHEERTRKTSSASKNSTSSETSEPQVASWEPVTTYVDQLICGSSSTSNFSKNAFFQNDDSYDGSPERRPQLESILGSDADSDTFSVANVPSISPNPPLPLPDNPPSAPLPTEDENNTEAEVPIEDRKPEDCLPKPCYKWFSCCSTSILVARTAQVWFLFRKATLQMVDHPAFEWVILALILSSSITLCFEDIYLDSNKPLQMALYYLNIIFTALFTLEMVLKWMAHGLVVYFTNIWSILDFIIVLVSIFSLAVENNGNLTALRSMRTLRALRPLRAISKWEGMKIVVNALVSSIPSIVNVLLVCVVFWLVFSIMGVQFFSGKFYKCENEDGERLPVDEVNNKTECLKKNYSWVNSVVNFDHVGQGYLALFQVATFEGWTEIMADASDARDVDDQPDAEANMAAYAYFIIFIVCGSFFTLNLFIGVIIDNFNMLKKKYEGGVLDMFLTESQKNYYAAMKKLGRKKPQKLVHRPKNAVQIFFYNVCMSRKFEMGVFVIIVLNMISMGIEHYDQPPEVDQALEIINIVFTSIFTIEALMKILAFRHFYFTIPWNIFDFVLVITSILGIVLKDLLTGFFISPTLLRVIRVFRIGRVLRLVKAAKGIRKLIFALMVSLPALFNIGALLFLIMFIYAIMGMSLFGYVKHQGVINDMVNFETFGNSMLLLFRLITSAGWSDMLGPLMVTKPHCDPTYRRLPNGNCGSPTFAVIFLVSYIIINYMIVINMYIAVILENFNQAHQEEELGIVEDDLEMFYVHWANFDPEATQFIPFNQVCEFLDGLDPPLRVPKPNLIAVVSFDVPIAQGDRVHCLDILHALIKYVLGHVDETAEFLKLRSQMEEKFKKQFPNRKRVDIVSSTMHWKKRDIAARTIQRAYRHWQRYRHRSIQLPPSRNSRHDSVTSGGIARFRRLSSLLTLQGVGRTPASSVNTKLSSSQNCTPKGRTDIVEEYVPSPSAVSESSNVFYILPEG